MEPSQTQIDNAPEINLLGFARSLVWYDKQALYLNPDTGFLHWYNGTQSKLWLEPECDEEDVDDLNDHLNNFTMEHGTSSAVGPLPQHRTSWMDSVGQADCSGGHSQRTSPA